jgi:SAM-dependent methyltransferase
MHLLPRRLVSVLICVASVAAGLASAGGVVADEAKKPPASAEELGRKFNEIYDNAGWAKGPDGQGTSGSGSTVEITKQYRAYLEEFIKSHKVRSVVDAGCGDWEFSSTIDWNHARYLGVDISTRVIESVKKKYESKNVRFKVGDVTESLPSADLLVCKDVLQHLPLALIAKFIKNNLKKGKYKWAIITNDRGPENNDIDPGNYRSINLGIQPFNVERLVDLPIHFEGQDIKTTQLLDLRR